MSVLAERLQARLAALHADSPTYATQAVDALLAAGVEAGASDLHLHPAADALLAQWRVNGVLEPLARLPAHLSANIVARLKVLAGLLTYRHDAPQEGRIRGGPQGVEVRVSTFPTLFGEKAVVRLFAERGKWLTLDDLGFEPEILRQLVRLLAETSGAILVTGPAGSGKTTTIYACLRHIVAQSGGGRSVASLEDPIEMAVEGVAQSQINAAAEFDLATGLRYLLRQDPEVIAVGEIRDPATAESAFQASLTGHLVLSTFHAGSAAGAISRLSDMGIAPYLLRSGVLAILSQRLARRLCHCARPSERPEDWLGLPVRQARLPVGCDDCQNTGYAGRMLLCEMLTAEPTELGRAILDRSDASRLEQLAVESGMVTRWRRACLAIEAGHTSPAEVRRVLGFSACNSPGNE